VLLVFCLACWADILDSRPRTSECRGGSVRIRHATLAFACAVDAVLRSPVIFPLGWLRPSLASTRLNEVDSRWDSRHVGGASRSSPESPGSRSKCPWHLILMVMCWCCRRHSAPACGARHVDQGFCDTSNVVVGRSELPILASRYRRCEETCIERMITVAAACLDVESVDGRFAGVRALAGRRRRNGALAPKAQHFDQANFVMKIHSQLQRIVSPHYLSTARVPTESRRRLQRHKTRRTALSSPLIKPKLLPRTPCGRRKPHRRRSFAQYL